VGGWHGEGGEIAVVGELLMDLSHWGQSRVAEGRHRAARPGLGPWAALRSRPRVALSSAQAPAVYGGPRPPGNTGAGSAAHDGSDDPTWNRGPGSGESSRPPATRRIVEAVWGWSYAVIELSFN
jgi:hypothetical protein